MYKIVKRDGSVTDFQISKIENVIEKAFQAGGRQFDSSLIQLLSLRVCADMEQKVKMNILNVEDVQDSVEKILSESGFSDVAKAFILYRKQREKARSIHSTLNDYKNIVDTYVATRVSVPRKDSIGGLILSNSGAITANYWLYEIYDEEISKAHTGGDIHIHGIPMLTSYSAGWSILELIQKGISGSEQNSCWPAPKLFHQLCAQIVNYLGILQNEWSGAQSLCSFDSYAAAYIKMEKLDFATVKEIISTMVYSLNMPSRWGTQTPFTQFTFDWQCPQNLRHEKCWIGNSQVDFTYGDCVSEMKLINRAFLEVMLEGDGQGRGFQYPIPSYPSAIVVTEDSPETKLLFQLAAKFGTPYFCHETADGMPYLKEKEPIDIQHLYRKAGGYFGYRENSGSIGIVSINLPRLAFLAQSEEEFFDSLRRKMELAARALERKREILEKSLQNGLYPYTAGILDSFDYHLSTIGVIGMNEACRNAEWIAEDLRTEAAIAFAKKVLVFMREECLRLQLNYGHLFSLEATPAEKTSYRLAKLDTERYPSILTASNDSSRPYYTNSSQLPVGYEEDIFMALDLQKDLQHAYTSGTVFHVFLEERLPDYLSAQTLIKKIHEHYHLPNLTLSPTYSICPQHGYLKGEKQQCPHCGKECEVWSRVSGYYRPFRNWNEGKQKEFIDRHKFGARSSVLKGNDVEKIVENQHKNGS